MKQKPLSRIDSFPYRHRVREIMSTPLVSVTPNTPVRTVAKMMVEQHISSVVVCENPAAGTDCRLHGIITERDILRTSIDKEGIGNRAAAEVMSSPMFTVSSDSYVFVALGRMARRNVRHLLVTDGSGLPVGMLTSRALLKLRAGDTLRLGDELADARTGESLGRVRAQLPTLAEKLLEEDVSALDASSVISAVYCDMTRRAWNLAVEEMEKAGRGGVPAPASVLVLGSGGRGESMLKPDQDNAIVHEGTDADDPWFAEAAEKMNVILDDAGVPFCKGKVMARHEAWRRTLVSWKKQVDTWIGTKDPDALMMTDIFFDFIPVAGDEGPAKALRQYAMEAVRGSIHFLTLIGGNVQEYTPPIGIFGGIKCVEGRVDLKLVGLIPVVTTARVMALQHGIIATSTGERVQALVEAGVLSADDAQQAKDMHAFFQEAILRQQLADGKAGVGLSGRIDPTRLSGRQLRELKRHLRAIEGLKLLLGDSLSAAFKSHHHRAAAASDAPPN